MFKKIIVSKSEVLNFVTCIIGIVYVSSAAMGSGNGTYQDQQQNPSNAASPTITIDDSSEDDDERGQYDSYVDYQQQPLNRNRGRDVHNKCCNNSVWCVRVSSYIFYVAFHV